MLIENPFPSDCFFAFLKNSDKSEGLFDSELSICRSYPSQKRRFEFKTGRRCAHMAIQSAGFQDAPILVNKDRSPIWPASITGSITHNDQFASAIIAKPKSCIISLGIDIENLNRNFNTDIAKYILTPNEIAKWPFVANELSEEAKAVFSIKESIFKCFYPINKIFLDFQDAEVVSIKNGKFKALLFKNPFEQLFKTPIKVEGIVSLMQDIVFTAIQFTAMQLEDLK